MCAQNQWRRWLTQNPCAHSRKRGHLVVLPFQEQSYFCQIGDPCMNALGVDFHVPKSTQKRDTGEKQLQRGVFLTADVRSWNFKMYSTMWIYSVRRAMVWKGNTLSALPHGSPQTAARAVPSLRLLHTAGLALNRLSGVKCSFKCSFVSVSFLAIFLSLLNYQNYFVQFSVLCISSSHHFQS